MAKALINSNMLVWASERAGMSAEAISERIKSPMDRVELWLSGDDTPTFRQAQKLAGILHIPFGFLFLDTPPEEDLPLPDLRTVGSDPARNLDTNFRDLLKDVLFKRDWFREYLDQLNGEPLHFVGSFGAKADPNDVAADMRQVLFGPDAAMPEARNWEEYLVELMRAADASGIWVMRSGIVGNNTHRPLAVEQFRGFAISDPIVPLIFINGRDAKAAQIFTLAHELAHIWLGQSGISNVFIGEVDFGVHRALERQCNQIAAEFLVPAETLRDRWDPDRPFSMNVDLNARAFRVSRVVIGRRAFDLALCPENEYRALYATESARWTRDAQAGGDGGDFYRTMTVRNGNRFTNSVVNQAISGQMLFRQAATLLNTQPASLVEYHRRRQAA